jgi:BioD-like phosphotransacetylase family protein
MPRILVAAREVGAGASTVAAGLAHRLAYAGHAVRLGRLAGDERAAGDARAFARLEFATAAEQPLAADALPATDEVLVLEARLEADAAALAASTGARLVWVAGPGGAGEAAPASASLVLANHARRVGPLAILEDRALAAPSVGQLIEASGARVVARGAVGDAAPCEHIVIGAISHDSNVPYFERFPRKAVVTRAERVDIVLAALRTDTTCVILSGGQEPSPYLLDRVAASRATTLLVAPEGTVETVRAIEHCFGREAFAGAEKAERAGALLAAAIDDATLAALLR